VYAVNFSDYLTFYVPQLTGWRHYAVSWLVVALITWINIRGIDAGANSPPRWRFSSCCPSWSWS